MHDGSCERRLLACGPCCVIEMCDCGAVHLTIGAITLRLRPEALTEIAAVIGDGARALALRQAFMPHGLTPSEALS